MFDRNGAFIKYDTEEEMLAVLKGDRLKPDLSEIFEQAMVVDAASHGWHTALDYMLQEMGCSPNDHDHKNYTPIGYAAMVGRTATVKKLLIEYDADPTMRNNAGRSMFDANEWFEGYTALELALEHEHYLTAFILVPHVDDDPGDDAFEELLNLGEDPDIEHHDWANHILKKALTRGQYSAVREMMGNLNWLEWYEEPMISVESLDALVKERAVRNWSRARKAVTKRWMVEYWRDCAARSHLERDRQTEVEAMAELMPPPLSPSPPSLMP